MSLVILKIGLYLHINNENAVHTRYIETETLKTDVDMFEMTNRTIKTWSNGYSYVAVCVISLYFKNCFGMNWLAHLPSGYRHDFYTIYGD